jgi:coatomer subunit beta
MTDLRAFLSALLVATNMHSLTPDLALDGDCGLLAANLYAHSIFGEDVLANVSIEKLLPDDPACLVTGHIRIRAKSQGLSRCFHYFTLLLTFVQEWRCPWATR